ncbi:MAG: type II toxin-antitoxin system VapC family toxin [Saprospiraceae bacterium]|nr:type II toxin-antitoxin system VapC family toxin [Saprospiraceae bacterium]MCF8250259.1 type II toxin-antitoxin system VapC family toxin [Saprospiraceae bacterium]MCF8280913.1 type II toxin-antitoxin system VapC family toxin [Bacteroidales bacterium]MCF8312109.1 type II toxin-antitoxin system VapC family toxin [Saprospiraceae bacterium]MCF8440516.1 type II toxin-antitoxin system VapC family toxin [Saprospiraceae bacterium]
MRFIFDTNIIIHLVRESPLKQVVERDFTPFSNENEAWVSAVVLGEIRSIAMQNKWGAKRLDRLNNYLSEFIVLDLNIESLHQRYAEIDAFSQGKHPTIPSNFSARNMGKNDLWIAATASLLEGTLLTTDSDFNHLNNEFLKVEKLS